MNGGAQVGDVAVVDNRWHHVVAVLPSTTLGSIVLYLDGQAVGKSQNSGSTVNTASSQDVRIGQDFLPVDLRDIWTMFVFTLPPFLPRIWLRFMGMDWVTLGMLDLSLLAPQGLLVHSVVIPLILKPRCGCQCDRISPLVISKLLEVLFPILPRFPAVNTLLRSPPRMFHQM